MWLICQAYNRVFVNFVAEVIMYYQRTCSIVSFCFRTTSRAIGDLLIHGDLYNKYHLHDLYIQTITVPLLTLQS